MWLSGLSSIPDLLQGVYNVCHRWPGDADCPGKPERVSFSWARFVFFIVRILYLLLSTVKLFHLRQSIRLLIVDNSNKVTTKRAYCSHSVFVFMCNDAVWMVIQIHNLLCLISHVFVCNVPPLRHQPTYGICIGINASILLTISTLDTRSSNMKYNKDKYENRGYVRNCLVNKMINCETTFLTNCLKFLRILRINNRIDTHRSVTSCDSKLDIFFIWRLFPNRYWCYDFQQNLLLYCMGSDKFDIVFGRSPRSVWWYSVIHCFY